MNKRYLPTKEAERVIWLNNFAAKIGGYASDFGISAAEVTLITKMALIYAYIIGLIASSKQFTKDLTRFKNILSIAPNGTTLGPLPASVPGTAPDLTQAGIFTFIAGIVARIKSNTNHYTVGIGANLGIIGEETVFVPDDYVANGSAVDKVEYVAIEFDKGHVDGMDIFSLPLGSSDMLLMEKIGTANFSPFHDTRPMMVPGKPEKRYYKTRAIIHDAEIGHYSEPFMVTFGG